MSLILAASDEAFRDHAFGRLLEAGYDDVRVADEPTALTGLLTGCESGAARATVVVGGTWHAVQPFLRVAAGAGALPIVLFESGSLEVEREALAMGARASLNSDMSAASLAAAVAAVHAGLIVMSPPPPAARAAADPTFRGSRPLTSRERQILSLVAGGTSNKGIARALSVSANTVKFHLAAVFDKLNAATRAEAVAEAIRRGELSL